MRSSAVFIAVLLHLHLLVAIAAASSSSAKEKLNSFLLEQYRLEPKATNDSFYSIPSWIKKQLSTPSPHEPPPKPSSLLSHKIHVPISVKLVGNTFTSSSSDVLSSFLSSAVSSDHFHIITPVDSNHRLSISHALEFDVSLSLNSLSTRLYETLKTQLNTTSAPLRSPLTSIPYSLIDDITKRLYETVKTQLHTTPALLRSPLTSIPYSLIDDITKPLYETLKTQLHTTPALLRSPLTSIPYIKRLYETLKTQLHTTPAQLRSPLTSIPYSLIDDIIKEDYQKQSPIDRIYVYILNLGPQSKPYAYSYTPEDPSPGVTKCLGNIWTGKERYIWIDLGAGPVDYGPELSGDGLLPKGEFHPLAAMHGRPKSEKALLTDLASLVWSAYQVLFVPSLRIPVPFEDSLVVQFIHFRGVNVDNSGLNWKSIENTFMDEVKDKGLLVGDQKLSFKTYEVKLSECSLCTFAITRATTSYTSRYFFDNYTLIVSEYLDSKKLHQTISESSEEFKRLAGLPEDDFGRVLPVYVFDLDLNANLMLDRYHQSVSFKDMVIAVRTGSTQTVSDYSCNGRHVFTQTRQLERPLVGSILQSMWGVSPTHLVWSPRHNSTLVDYTWSIGQTPFGPFSEISSLSFIQKDSARRNFLLTSLNYTITSALEILDAVASHGGERTLFKGHQESDFLLRWRLFEYKLEKAVSALSHFDFEMALYYSTSSEHDLYAMHSVVYRASQDLEATLSCFKDPPFPWVSFFASVGIVFCVLYAFAKRDKLFRNKRKQF